MGDVFAFGSENALVPGMAKANQGVAWISSMDCVGTQRKGLVDVTNIEQNAKLSHPDSNTLQIPAPIKEYIDQIHKENLELKKLIAEKNKIIELTGVELKGLRLNMQRMHRQNWQIAQANSQMLAELNNGKDRLKAMHHELGCLKCLLPLKRPPVQDKKKVQDNQQTSSANEMEEEANVNEQKDEVPPLASDSKETKHSNTNNRRRSRAFGTSAATKDTAVKEKCETKRSGKRRQSTRLSKYEEQQPVSTEDDLFEIDDAKFPLGSQHSSGDSKLDDTTSVHNNSNDTMKEEENDECRAGSLPAPMRRSSIGRPLRQAAVKVNTYKEAPLNVKMRRTS